MRFGLLIKKTIAIFFCGAIFSGCASLEQPSNEVYRRESGGQLLPWKSLGEAATIHWPYAWSALAAYQDSDDPKRKPLDTDPTCPEPHLFLAQRGWTQWMELPSIKEREFEQYPDAAARMRFHHLRAEAWSNEQTNQVIVAFGGTAATSINDWKANLRWFFQFFNNEDEYTILTDTFIPIFIDTYKKRQNNSNEKWLEKASIIATGHSLGGGLSQRFAYSLEKSNGIPVVKHVYAFDPSPVSGKVSSPNFATQADGLTIYRIYNRGEILASLRSLLQLGNPNNERNQGQVWIDIRYLSNWSWKNFFPSGSVHAHGMHDLAKFIAKNIQSENNQACRDDSQ